MLMRRPQGKVTYQKNLVPATFLHCLKQPWGNSGLGTNGVLDPEGQQQELLIILVERNLSGAFSGPPHQL